MKNFILYLWTLLLFSPVFYAQDKEDNPDFKQYSSSVFKSKEAALNVVSSMNKKITTSDMLNYNQTSGVLIQQIGDYNKVNAALIADETNLAVNQSGEGNEFFLDKTAKTITQNVIQQGDNNKITDFTLRTNYNINIEMSQKGDNQSIQNIGTNSISKNMKINQTGNGASVIILNKLN